MRGTLVGLLAVLAGAPVAQAAVPSAGEVTHARSVAFAYWHGNPPCGSPAILFAPTPEAAPGVHALGLITEGSCTITLSTDAEYRPDWTCVRLTHEWGHLMLGPIYFQAVNPADPAHSPDPNNIMNATGPVRFPPCEPHRHHRHHHRVR